MALPVKVSFNVFKSAAPEVFGVKVTVAILLTAAFVRPEVVPKDAALGVSVVRKIVMMLLVALPVTVVAMFELAPRAVTLADEIEKVDVELSFEPCELNVATSPFKVTVSAPACGMIIGVPKWKV